MGGGSNDLFNEMPSKWWAVLVTIVLNEMSSKWWAVVVTIFLMKCQWMMGGGSDDLFNEMSVNDGRW